MSNLVTLARMLFKRTPARATEWGLFDKEPERKELHPEFARAELETVIRHYGNKQGYFEAGDLLGVLRSTGRTRAWLHQELQNRLDDGTIIYDEDNARYEVMI